MLATSMTWRGHAAGWISLEVWRRHDELNQVLRANNYDAFTINHSDPRICAAGAPPTTSLEICESYPHANPDAIVGQLSCAPRLGPIRILSVMYGRASISMCGGALTILITAQTFAVLVSQVIPTFQAVCKDQGVWNAERRSRRRLQTVEWIRLVTIMMQVQIR